MAFGLVLMGIAAGLPAAIGVLVFGGGIGLAGLAYVGVGLAGMLAGLTLAVLPRQRVVITVSQDLG